MTLYQIREGECFTDGIAVDQLFHTALRFCCMARHMRLAPPTLSTLMDVSRRSFQMWLHSRLPLTNEQKPQLQPLPAQQRRQHQWLRLPRPQTLSQRHPTVLLLRLPVLQKLFKHLLRAHQLRHKRVP